MKLVGWTSLWAVLMVGVAIAQADVVVDEPEETAQKQKVEVPSDVPETYKVKEGDTLWDITESYYGDPYRWPQVWSYNPDITNPHWIYPDLEIRLRPGDEDVIKTAPTGFKRAAATRGGAQAVYMAEYGFLNKDALQDAGFIIGANEEHMMMVDTDITYVRFNKDVEPEIGKVYTVFRKMREIEREPSEEGELVRILGEVLLQDYDMARGVGHGLVVDSIDGLERGFRLAAFERNFYWVDVVPAERSIRATVVASLYPRKLPSTNQIVFVNVGAEQGVVLGNRFYIVRQGDEWRESTEGRVGREIETTVPLPNPPKHYPWEVVALGRAVNVQPKTTAILLEKAERAVRMGDRAELRKGE
jgi:hypothetical protein